MTGSGQSVWENHAIAMIGLILSPVWQVAFINRREDMEEEQKEFMDAIKAVHVLELWQATMEEGKADRDAWEKKNDRRMFTQRIFLFYEAILFTAITALLVLIYLK